VYHIPSLHSNTKWHILLQYGSRHSYVDIRRVAREHCSDRVRSAKPPLISPRLVLQLLLSSSYHSYYPYIAFFIRSLDVPATPLARHFSVFHLEFNPNTSHCTSRTPHRTPHSSPSHRVVDLPCYYPREPFSSNFTNLGSLDSYV
jgi:hypothetical protein